MVRRTSRAEAAALRCAPFNFQFARDPTRIVTRSWLGKRCATREDLSPRPGRDHQPRQSPRWRYFVHVDCFGMACNGYPTCTPRLLQLSSITLRDVVRRAPQRSASRSVPAIIRCRRAILGVRQVFAVRAIYPEPSRPSVALAPPSYPEDYPRQAAGRHVDQR